MNKVSRKFLETITNFVHTASKDETRTQLYGVNIQKLDDHILVQATDGYALSQYKDYSNEMLELELDSIILDRDYIKGIKDLLKNFKHRNSFFVEITEQSFNVTTSNFDSVDTVKVRLINREYPKTSSVVPKKLEDNIEFMINPEYIINLAKSMDTKKAKSKGIVFSLQKENGHIKPILVSNGEYSGVIMPMKI